MNCVEIEKQITEHKGDDWRILYPLLKEMKEEKRYREEGFSSFTAWTKSHRTNFSDNYLWRIYNGGKVYEEYVSRNKDAVPLGRVEVSVDNLTSIRKITKNDISKRDELVRRLLEGELHHKDIQCSLGYIRGRNDEVGTPIWLENGDFKSVLINTVAKDRTWLGKRKSARYRLIKIHSKIYVIESISADGIHVHELDTDYRNCRDTGSKADYYWLVVDASHVKEACVNRLPYWGVLCVENGKVHIVINAPHCLHPKRMDLLEDIISATLNVLQ
jgi:hypothetical protein